MGLVGGYICLISGVLKPFSLNPPLQIFSVFTLTHLMAYLNSPNLDLFVYQLRKGLGDSEDDIQKNHKKFWANLPAELQELAQVSYAKESEESDAEYLKLLPIAGKNKAAYDFSKKAGEYLFQGYYYPVQMGDTYGLLFDAFIDLPYDSPSHFQTLKNLAANKQGNLGKTWIISCWLSGKDETNPEVLAKQIYEECKFGEWQQPNRGKFLGADVFEVWHFPHNSKKVEDNLHVLIILYPHRGTAKAAAKYYDDWMRLFCYRNKIIWAYSQSRELKQRLESQYAFIFKKAESLKKQNLKELQSSLQEIIETLSNYVCDINYLEIHLHTIKINQRNYQELLKYIIGEASKDKDKDGETQLDCLSEFNRTVKQKYQIQIQEDRASLSPALRVLEDLISSIRGMIEAEQAQSDRDLNYTIAIASFGLALSGVTATIISTQLSSPKDPPEKSNPISQSDAFGWSIIPPIAIAAIIWGVRRFLRPR